MALTANKLKRLHVQMRPTFWAYLNWVANKELTKRNLMLERMVWHWAVTHPYPDAPTITENPDPEEDYHAQPDIDLWEDKD